MSDQQYSAGAELRRAREAAGMTTHQVSEATRIRRAIVEAIERDDLEPSGGMAYARGHIKSIAAVLGLDPAPLLARLGAPTVAETSPHPEPAPAPPRSRPERIPSPSESLAQTLGGAGAAAERRRPNWSAVMALALVVVLGVGVVRVLGSSSSSDGPPTAGPVTTPTTPATEPSAGPSIPQPTSSPTEPDAIAQADTVNVVLTVTGSASWVSASTSKGTVFEGTLTTGERKTFKDRKKIRFVFGNAGGVSLQVNGVDIGSPGDEGQVVRAAFGPDDPDSSRA